MYTRIFTLVASLMLGYFLVHVSFSFGAPPKEIEIKSEAMYGVSTRSGAINLEELPFPYTLEKPNLAYYKNLGRLAFVFFNQDTNSNTPADQILTYSGTDIQIKSGDYIFGLYDPFITYRIESDTYRLEQITNGSIYTMTEEDGTISIYAIDGVVRLYFLFEGKEMTDMILFPGNYIRFDPKRNRELDKVDLFRVILSLDVGSNQTFEYVNPKVDSNSSLTNYRFGGNNQLIRILHKYLQEKVENIAGIRLKYQNTNTFEGVSENSLFLNPTKKNYFLLLSLSKELARTVDSFASKTGAVMKISSILKDANQLQIGDTSGQLAVDTTAYPKTSSFGIENSVRSTLEQFIIDGRYAAYGGRVSKDFESIYTAIAAMIGISPESKKSRILQDLSNIYTKNIVSTNSQGAINKSDVYAATASILLDSLSSQDSLTAKDYFDIAVYSSNILQKNENEGRYMQESLKNLNTYRLLQIFFEASALYYESIDSPEKKELAIQTFAIQFYDRIFSSLSEGIIDTFTTKNSEGYVVIKSEYKDDTRIIIDPIVIRGIRDSIEKGESIIMLLESIPIPQNTNTNNNIKSRIKKSVIIGKNFLRMTDNYREYVRNLSKSLEDEYIDPATILSGATLEISSGTTLPPVQTATQTEETLKLFKKLFPKIDESFVEENAGIYSIKQVPVEVTDTKGERHSIFFSANFDATKRDFSTIEIKYLEMNIQVMPEIVGLSRMSRYILFMGDYLSKLEALLKIEGNLGSDIRFAFVESMIYLKDRAIPVP